MKEKRYNHAMDISFAVPNSEYENYWHCLEHEKQMVINALQKRVREVFEGGEYLEAIGGIDTYEEGEFPPITNPDLVKTSWNEKTTREEV